jgi:tetratricopeptide (TPR) repeat protein
MRRLLLGLFLALAASPASAVVIVLGNGTGHECYVLTILDPTPENNQHALAVCTRAVNDAAAATDADPYDRAAAFVNRSDIYLRLENYNAAAADAREAVALEGNLAPAQVNLGAALVGLQRYDEAMTWLNKVIEANGGSQDLAYFNRGLAKESMGDIKGAYYDYLKAVEINPKMAVASEQLTRFKVITTPG